MGGRDPARRGVRQQEVGGPGAPRSIFTLKPTPGFFTFTSGLFRVLLHLSLLAETEPAGAPRHPGTLSVIPPVVTTSRSRSTTRGPLDPAGARGQATTVTKTSPTWRSSRFLAERGNAAGGGGGRLELGTGASKQDQRTRTDRELSVPGSESQVQRPRNERAGHQHSAKLCRPGQRVRPAERGPPRRSRATKRQMRRPPQRRKMQDSTSCRRGPWTGDPAGLGGRPALCPHCAVFPATV